MATNENQRKEILKTFQMKEKKAILKEAELKSQAFNSAIKVSNYLREKYKIKEVYLYGSLAADGHFDIYSDIDLFIVGWKDETSYWIMMSDAQMIAKPFSISIATEKDALPSLKEVVYKQGRLL